MNEEKKMILDMLKEGKITVEQASDLLEAVGKDKSKNNEESFVDKLSTSFEKIMKKTSETISNFDFDIDLDSVNIPNIYHINSQKTENQTKIDDDVNAIEIDLINGSLDIERAQENHIMVDEKVYFKNKEDQVNDYLNIEVVEDKLIVSVNENYKSLDASANVKLYLGKNIYDSLDINIVNGQVELCDVDFKENNIESTNARFTIINSAGNIDLKNTNGKIEIRNTNGNLEVSNVNGSVYLSNISGENANVDIVNGSIRIDGLNMENVAKYLNTSHGLMVTKYGIEVQYRDIIDKPDYFRGEADFFYQICTKGKDWEHEQEIRLFISKPFPICMALPYKPKDKNEIIDWKDMRAYPKIGRECFEFVYLGVNIDKKEKDEIIQIAREVNPDIKINQMEINSNAFRLDVNPEYYE